jgi:hypothetical protein
LTENLSWFAVSLGLSQSVKVFFPGRGFYYAVIGAAFCWFKNFFRYMVFQIVLVTNLSEVELFVNVAKEEIPHLSWSEIVHS